MSSSDKLKLLILDDEREILNALKRVFFRDYEVSCFEEGNEALAAMSEKEFAVIISDMRMPHMDGATFLAKAKELSPGSKRILLTGYSDMESTVKAVNDGAIFSYVNKPWDNNEIKVLVRNAAESYILQKENEQLNEELSNANFSLSAKNQLLDQKVQQRSEALLLSNERLKTSIGKQRELFNHLLDMVEAIIEASIGSCEGHNKRIASHAKLLCQSMGLEKSVITQIYFATLMSDIGKITLPAEILQTPEEQLSQEQKVVLQNSVLKGAEILQNIPNLKTVATLVRHQYEKFNGQGVPDHLSGDNIPLGSRIIKVLSDYDNMLIGRKFKNRKSPAEAASLLKSEANKEYDPLVVQSYLRLLEKLPKLETLDADYCLTIEQLEPGMTLAHDVVNKAGGTMLTKGTQLTDSSIEKLKQYQKQMEYHLSIFVY